MRASTDAVKHHASVLLSHQGSDALPAYSLRHPDPALPGSKNRYAVALYDSYNPDILFGEVLLIPQWTKSTKEETRLNGGLPPPPQPVLPTEFVIQLYNPDQQVTVKWYAGTWNTAPYWGFEMPVQSFRQPSSSAIDRVQSDPTASENTPMLGFKWKKDGKLSRDYVCSLAGKSTNPDGSKKKQKEPDITVALFKHFKEITLYEPNLSRVDLEDPKGLEVVLILGSVVIREVFNSNVGESFNVSDPAANASHAPTTSAHQPRHKHRKSSNPAATQQTSSNGPADPRPPPTDARTQWELDMEEARLKNQVAHEERGRKRREEAETKRVQKMMQDEESQRREKQKAVDRETERLKRIYGREQRQGLQPIPPNKPPRSHGHAVTSYPPAPVQRPHSAAAAPYFAHNLRPQQMQYPAPQPGPYLQPPGSGAASSSNNFGGAPSSTQQALPKKSSFWHLGKKHEDSSRLTKQRSVVF